MKTSTSLISLMTISFTKLKEVYKIFLFYELMQKLTLGLCGCKLTNLLSHLHEYLSIKPITILHKITPRFWPL